ncbi:Gfo/Idh/MocA family oxidoreductase [Fodinibius salsisoli]|uniref:Gfo/Idh/MocA family oxidoreductase n=1 Tax=Fodinibius salsisoli TaxID=2820877 RepID=A0ABT3PT94_9BACT|nr:Gfo/Idh/MocA family oxidoreductase [Fodinibius salsisoli]MCW9709083.1 Gfo/Idh/MocA family oxidoreductase [Fodinibius salsisoli]
MSYSNISRKDFLQKTSGAMAGTMLANPVGALGKKAFGTAKKRIALVGTGIRGITFWGKTVRERYGDITEFVGLCDINPGRLEYGKNYIGADCPTFTDFDEMMDQTNPDMLIVTTVDATHHQFIINGLERGVDVLTEKPMTTDEVKCQAILDAEEKSEADLIVGFNYRYSPHHTKLKEMLVNQRVGKITSVDFHWYLNTYHGASYFRRWHGIEASGGTLLVHKATHHFDLLNWWLDSDPVEVYAEGALEHYGSNNDFRGNKCRTCPHQNDCDFYWDITDNDTYMDLYVANEEHDGYIRDNCLWRHEINIYDKMSVQIKYANDVQVTYSLTTYSPYEGMEIAFNGFDGRIDAWHGIPWRETEKVNQAELHAQEMSQQEREEAANYEEIMVMDNFAGEYDHIKVQQESGGHGGGDVRLQNQIFRDPDMADPLEHSAGIRDGAMSILIGIAARKSIKSGQPVRIEDLTSFKPHPTRDA